MLIGKCDCDVIKITATEVVRDTPVDVSEKFTGTCLFVGGSKSGNLY